MFKGITASFNACGLARRFVPQKGAKPQEYFLYCKVLQRICGADWPPRRAWGIVRRCLKYSAGCTPDLLSGAASCAGAHAGAHGQLRCRVERFAVKTSCRRFIPTNPACREKSARDGAFRPARRRLRWHVRGICGATGGGVRCNGRRRCKRTRPACRRPGRPG